MAFAIKVNGNLWMSFIDGDYRDYKDKNVRKEEIPKTKKVEDAARYVGEKGHNSQKAQPRMDKESRQEP